MKVCINISPVEQTKVTIECREITPVIKQLAAWIEDQEKLHCTKDGNTYLLGVNDVYYFECVDDKIFAYTKGEVYQSAKRLYELEEYGKRFMRIGKSCIVNICKISSLKAMLSGKIELTLDNGERLIITRAYAKEFRKRLDNI